MLKSRERTTAFPSRPSNAPAGVAQQFSHSVKFVQSEVFSLFCDELSSSGMFALARVVGWDHPVRKVFMRDVTRHYSSFRFFQSTRRVLRRNSLVRRSMFKAMHFLSILRRALLFGLVLPCTFGCRLIAPCPSGVFPMWVVGLRSFPFRSPHACYRARQDDPLCLTSLALWTARFSPATLEGRSLCTGGLCSLSAPAVSTLAVGPRRSLERSCYAFGRLGR